MSRTVQVTFDSHDPERLARFWAEALGYIVPGPPGIELGEDDDPIAAWKEFAAGLGIELGPENMVAAIEDPEGTGPRVFFQTVPEDKTVKNRVHLDIRAAPGLDGDERMDTLEAECARLTALGGSRLRRVDPDPPMEAGFIVMTDPEGNEFCLD
ncbi:VOC family protein [Brevibacterium spongiae]|uniref:VOC family protein n=1 Tax=Brevibacterium spongiae TaxID=2909672 RepID=A0ABY5SWU4_9MICO|nr:VOC family protein [Brevibacterium spongiae]UVI37506.1 VOC family protein [Brevibacterium spongiae]